MRLRSVGGVGRQAQLDLVAAVGADHGVGDAGVAAGGIENDAAMIQLAGALAVEHHIQRCAVFDRAAGVEVLGLAEDLDIGKLAGNLVQAHQRRVADGLEQRLRRGPRQVRYR